MCKSLKMHNVMQIIIKYEFNKILGAESSPIPGFP